MHGWNAALLRSEPTMGKRGGQSGSETVHGDEPIVVLAGKEAYLQRMYLRTVEEAVARRTGQEVETVRFDGDDAELADVLDEIRSVGLLQQHKLVVVDQADALITNHRGRLERYAERPSTTGTLVLRPSSWATNTRLHKAVEKTGKVFRCDPPRPDQVAPWVEKRAANAHGRPIEKDAAALLAQRVGTDLLRIDNELAKVACAGEATEPIRRGEVETLVPTSSEESAWAIQDALLSGDPSRAVGKLDELLSVARQPDALIGRAMADLLRNLHHAATLLERDTGEEAIARKLRIFSSRRRAFFRAARRLGRPTAARLFGRAVDLDARAKRGYGEVRRNLERLAVEVTQALR